MTHDNYDVLFDALMTAESLIDDLLALEAAGLPTGFKKGVVKKYQRENAKALQVLQATVTTC